MGKKKKSVLIQVEGTKESKGRTKITLVEVIQNDIN